ncbi:MAG TPA: sulfur carrier protein ThiS [Arachidicoccus soli]|uniref:Sulfur carrier protein ThiS n=1 Tax=Arachidicoccus soli TaxID=2341117 RepID=A0A386HQD8_9BACT|nr:sulfur carrier protein ThiS [Arachidicoccus soli]AYD47700.1 sulfur carrier protein ThiS [Arachidicoccus soli]HEU0227697.1 sulfur carrier protein ThiS [Arachidicoccus soli]
MINIHINERPLEIENHFNVLQLLEKVNAPTEGIALAINNNIISKSNWQAHFLSENDKVLIIQATQGG